MSRLDEIRERLNKATPGPWQWDFENNHLESTTAFDEFEAPDGRKLRSPMLIAWQRFETYADEDLIAHAPTDLRYLLEQIEKQTQLLQRARRVMADTSGCYPECCDYCPNKTDCSSKTILDEIAMYDNPKAGAGTL